MEMTSLWTFASALALLKTAPEDYISDALDDFLIHNNDVLLSPLPFERTDKSKPLDKSTKDFTLRGILYTGVTPSLVATATSVAELCHTDFKETLRVILQTIARVPELLQPEKSAGSIPSRLPNEEDAAVERDRVSFYASVLLKERRTVLRVTAECFNNRFNEYYSSTVRNLGKSLAGEPSYTVRLVGTAQAVMRRTLLTETSSDLESLVITENVLACVDILKLICEILVSSPAIDKSVVQAWFLFMESSNFAHSLGSVIADKELFTLIQALCTIVSLQVFDLSYSHGNTAPNLYLEDGSVFLHIDNVIRDQDPNDIIKYAWLIMLYKKSIILEEFPQEQTQFLSAMRLSQVQKSMAVLQQSLDGSKVFEEVRSLNEFLKFDNVFAVVLSNLIMTALPLVSMSSNFASCVAEVLRAAPNSSVEKFFENQQAVNALILARAKFPISLEPYLKLASINGNFALHEFEELKSYMAVFDKTEFGRMYDIDSENTDLVKTSQIINLYPPFEVNHKLSFLMNYDTKAKIVPTADESKILVTFLHKYNGWAFLGRVLQNISKVFDIADQEKTSILHDMLDVLIATTEQNPPESIHVVLEYMSAYIDDSDIVDVLFRLFEQGLHNRSIELLEKLLRLFTSMMPVISHRIWPYLSASSLLPSKGKEGFHSILFGSVEMTKGDYQFTTALVKFVFSLSQNCLSLQTDYPLESKSELFSCFIEHLLFVFESYTGCKFNDGFQKLELGVLILDVLRQTLESIHLIDPGVDSHKKATHVFANASERIVDVFLSTETKFIRSATPILMMIDSVAKSVNYYEAKDFSGFFADVWIHSALSFSRLLVTIRSTINGVPSAFEKELFARLPQLVTVYSRGGHFRKLTLDLITALTNGVWQHEPMPSMLSHLGREHSRIFLNSLAVDLDNAFDDYTIKISIYDFLCAIMEANQQGLAILFISGRDVFGEFTSETKTDAQLVVSLLSILRRNVKNIKYYPHSVTVHLLDAISLAFNSWTTERDEESDVSFVEELVTMLGNFEKDANPSDSYDFIVASYQSKLYSKVAEILSLVLFTSKNDKFKQSIGNLLSREDFLSKLPGMFTIKNFQMTLYDQVALQFSNVFPDHKLTQFAVAIQKRNRFGIGAVYDLILMDTLFQRHPKWKDLRDQIIYSSANIQYFNAQMALAKSLGALITAFCRKVPTKIPREYLGLVPKLLNIRDPRDSYTEPFLVQLTAERVELGFLISYTMNNMETVKKSPETALDIIEACGDLMRTTEFSDTNGQGVPQRSLLRLIYVALSELKDEYELLIARFSVLNDVFDTVIARRTKSIVSELQNEVYLSRTHKKRDQGNLELRFDDMKLILSIMKCFLLLNLSLSLLDDLAECLANAGTVDSLLSFYLFSHLILVNEEPVCAQLSLMFIQQLLAVDTFAERFVGRNIFMVIRESVISQALRGGGITISNAPAIYKTWTSGILPILVGALVKTAQLSEVVATIRCFSKQIESCIESWARELASLQISTAGTWETTQVLLLYHMLRAVATKYLDNDAEANVPMPGLESQQKRDDFVDYINNLLKHPKFLSSRIVPSNAEEAAVIKAGGAPMQNLVSGLVEDIGELKQYLL